jgi:hypothetical protein
MKTKRTAKPPQRSQGVMLGLMGMALVGMVLWVNQTQNTGTGTGAAPATVMPQPVTEAAPGGEPLTLTLTVTATATVTSPGGMMATPVVTRETWYAGAAGANLRRCAGRTCEAVTQVSAGTALVLAGQVTGEAVDGNEVWYVTEYQGETVYVHGGAVTQGGPGPAPVDSPTVPAQSVPDSGSACPRPAATCGDLVTCEQARACLAAGNSSLDRDKDGVPCESLCGGS